ncbi:MAG: hypothetical protein J3Q66DRAFT_358851 [Benniella sp.]|nr:MAG: hypothetical protein J3Q66DRAFT_358851 [Benniella sp.]
MAQHQEHDQPGQPRHHEYWRHHMDKPTPSPQIASPQQDECTLWSLVQYECDLSPERIVCRPIYRILKKCKGMPTVEVTPLYDPFGNVLHT